MTGKTLYRKTINSRVRGLEVIVFLLLSVVGLGCHKGFDFYVIVFEIYVVKTPSMFVCSQWFLYESL